MRKVNAPMIMKIAIKQTFDAGMVTGWRQSSFRVKKESSIVDDENEMKKWKLFISLSKKNASKSPHEVKITAYIVKKGTQQKTKTPEFHVVRDVFGHQQCICGWVQFSSFMSPDNAV